MSLSASCDEHKKVREINFLSVFVRIFIHQTPVASFYHYDFIAIFLSVANRFHII